MRHLLALFVLFNYKLLILCIQDPLRATPRQPWSPFCPQGNISVSRDHREEINPTGDAHGRNGLHFRTPSPSSDVNLVFPLLRSWSTNHLHPAPISVHEGHMFLWDPPCSPWGKHCVRSPNTTQKLWCTFSLLQDHSFLALPNTIPIITNNGAENLRWYHNEESNSVLLRTSAHLRTYLRYSLRIKVEHMNMLHINTQPLIMDNSIVIMKTFDYT